MTNWQNNIINIDRNLYDDVMYDIDMEAYEAQQDIIYNHMPQAKDISCLHMADRGKNNP